MITKLPIHNTFSILKINFARVSEMNAVIEMNKRTAQSEKKDQVP
jgi:hypothetical protein